MENFDVVVAGAGPSGMTLAIDLGRRGVRTLLLERNDAPGPWPKMERCTARTMEIYHRMGLADRIRAVGFPPEISMDVYIVTRLDQPPIAKLPYPSVGAFRTDIMRCTDDTMPREPYQLVSQYAFEPVLKAEAEATPNVTMCFGHEIVALEQDADGVAVTARKAGGEEKSFRARYAVGCDGGSSFVRKSLDIKLEGDGSLQQMSQVHFRSDDLFYKIPVGRGRHYYFVDSAGSAIVVQGSCKDFALHTTLPPDTDFPAAIRELLGFDVDLEVMRVNRWTLHLLLAERYRDGRVFLAGDAAHLVIPTGGLGMNTAIGDAHDLGWKLAGAIKGWGGPQLLDSYEIERRPVGQFNVNASRFAAMGLGTWRRQVTPEVFEQSERGAYARAAIARMAEVFQRRGHEMHGAELSYNYCGSPLVMREEGTPPIWEIGPYIPSTVPGARLPHVWLTSGQSTLDVAGSDFTLIDLTGTADCSGLQAAFAARSIPLHLFQRDEAHARAVLGHGMFLVRPDLHIVWRGDALSDQNDILADVAGGYVAEPPVATVRRQAKGFVGG